tara:strand:- start:4419 stop:5174 length:756 start_codon:yes stop_codon:yes gene_type:complete
MGDPSTRVAYVRDARRDALRAVLEHGGLAEALGSVEGEVHIRGEVRGGDLGSDHEHPSSTRDATSSDVASLNIRDELLRDAQLIPEKIHEAINSLELDITNVVKEYCAVANTPSAIVSLSLLRKTLCSKYHVDYVPLRVMVTYLGAGTEILSENSSLAISMTSDRIGRQAGDIVKTIVGDGDNIFGQKKSAAECEVVLMKGEKWPGNVGRAIVHRSPAVDGCCGEWRLCLKIDAPEHVNAVEFGMSDGSGL